MKYISIKLLSKRAPSIARGWREAVTAIQGSADALVWGQGLERSWSPVGEWTDLSKVTARWVRSEHRDGRHLQKCQVRELHLLLHCARL